VRRINKSIQFNCSSRLLGPVRRINDKSGNHRLEGPAPEQTPWFLQPPPESTQ
jgi:hypothetical protein